MLAHHPATGQPIRILRTGTQIASDLKTLVWIQKSFQQSHRWLRWYCVVTEPEAVSVCGPENLVAIVLTRDSILEQWLPILQTLVVENSDCLLVVPHALLPSISFPSERTLVWEELFESYPYLGEPIQSSDSVEKVLVSVAHVLRMNRIVWSFADNREQMPFGLRSQIDAWMKQCNGVLQSVSLDTTDSCIPRTWLIQQYYKSSSNRRSREIHTCLTNNLASPWIDHILLLNEKEENELPVSPKLQTILLGHRLTYLDVFRAILQHVPKHSFVVFANSDIWFQDSLVHLWRISLLEKRMFLALLRWEHSSHEAPKLFGPRPDSQDTWIVARDAIDFVPNDTDFGFPFGKSGCDNAIALIMMRKKFLIVNPAYSIQTIHLHSSNVRTYDPKDILYRSHYLYIDPTYIQVCSVQTNIDTQLPESVSKAWNTPVSGQSFLRPIYEIHKGSATAICSVLTQFRPDDKNIFTPNPNSAPLYNFHDVFVTPEGLISTCREIVVGKHTAWANQWETVRKSSLTQCIHVPNLLALPWKADQPFRRWVLHYLPRVLTIWNILRSANLPIPEFLIPNNPEVGSFLTDCVWGENSMKTVVPILENMDYYSNNVWAVPPHEEQEQGQLITREDIESLRALLPPHDPAPSTTAPILVFCVEDDESQLCTRSWAEEVSQTVLPSGWTVRYLSSSDSPSQRRKALRDASWMVGSGAALEWMWYLPSGATVLEFMSESNPDGYTIHLAGACQVRYVLSVVKQELFAKSRQTALMDVGRAIKQFGFREMIQEIRTKNTVMPTIVIPSGAGLQGFWNHADDTFREMITIWEERNYIRLVKSEQTRYCWWGGIGEILLYDWDTPRWWTDVPSYQMALFGNCPPPGPAHHLLRQSTWCFWPRSPKAVEHIANRLENVRSYESRPIASLFLGKVENGVQRTNRLSRDWSSSVELFSMPVDPYGKPYPYSQKEYLEKLCNARFGLCLPGFGNKCNREIEYFACGCVPIITDGVDMKHYLAPPREGVHYFKASSPEEVSRIVKETSIEQWTAMSMAGREWWYTFASAEGLFRLTWARIEQCRPYFHVGIPRSFPLA